MIAVTLGGIGLFLLGMILLTDGLKAAAGDSLRRVLSKFTGGPMSALLSGATVTALVQSSSATTLATIGFVSAGILSFPQAVGVIFGANLGTTSTGWLVSLLGLKFSIAAAALPLVGVGALTNLLGRGRLRAMGLALAGFGLIFVGIDTLQGGMEVLAQRIDPSIFPKDSFIGRVVLVLIGVVMTVVMQSSSAAVATTLAALHTNTIGMEQAAALVIGQNVGTTITAAIAAIGASVPAKRTALAHILFNGVTGVMAFALLPLFVGTFAQMTRSSPDLGAATSLAAFHTVFNLVGVLAIMPWVNRFAALVVRLVPDKGPRLTRFLDDSVATIPAVAVEATHRSARAIAAAILSQTQALLMHGRGVRQPPLERTQIQGAIDEARQFLAKMHTAPESPVEHRRHLGVLHALDHMELLLSADELRRHSLDEAERAASVVVELADELSLVLQWLSTGEGRVSREKLAHLAESTNTEALQGRRRILQETARGLLTVDAAYRQIESLRWLRRTTYHAWRIVHHLTNVDAAPNDAAASTAPASSSPEQAPEHSLA